MKRKILLISLIMMSCVLSFSQTRLGNIKANNGPRKYSLRVTSNARPFTVFINGRQIQGDNIVLNEDRYTIEVKSNNFSDFRTNIVLNKNMVINATLNPIARNYSLIVNSNVNPFIVLIDGNQIRGNKITLPEGNHSVTVQSNNYIDFNTNINLNKNMVVNAKLNPMVRNYSLIVNSNVNPFIVLIDGNQISGNKITLPEGNHSVSVKSNDFIDFNTNINLNKNMVVNATLNPIIRNYSLVINSNVNPYVVFIDGKQINGNNITLPAGNHNVLVKSNNFLDYQTNVNLNQNMSINATLMPIYASVVISLPDNIINKRIPGAVNQIKVFDNGTLLNGFNYSLTAGNHLIRIESGGIAFENNFDFVPGNSYTITPSMFLNIK